MRALPVAAVLLGAFLVLSFHAGQVGLAETYVDPVARIPAQDEAVYSSTALGMAERGGWLTPMFLGRYALYKPPALYWLSGASVKIWGDNVFALRLPSLLAGAALVGLLFVWIRRAHSLSAAVAAALLLLVDRVFFALSRLVLTDALVVLCIAAAMWCVFRNPGLVDARYRWMFGIAVGAAILTKGVAGFLPLLMLIGTGVPLRRFAQVCGVGALVAAPWHVYQLMVHTRWFWDEYILTEHFTWALAAPAQSTQENQLLYYLRRLWLLDPLLCVAALAGIPAAARTRNRLAAVWIGVVFLAFFGFGYRNTSYLLLLVPGLVLLAAGALKWRVAAVAVIAVATWKLPALPYGPEHTMPSIAGLRAYAGEARDHDLLIVAPDDEFVSSTLKLRHVRYVYFDEKPEPPPLPLDFRYLGITVTVPQFNNMGQWLPVFRRRLLVFGLPSTEAVATVIVARGPEELRDLMAAHPGSDFSLPDGLMPYADPAHRVLKQAAGRTFALSATP